MGNVAALLIGLVVCVVFITVSLGLMFGAFVMYLVASWEYREWKRNRKKE